MEAIRNMSKREKVLLLILLALGSAFLFWNFLASHWWDQYVLLREEVSQAREEQAYLENRLAQVPEVEEEWELYQDKEDELKELLPSVEHLPLVLAELENTLAEAETEVRSLRADGVTWMDGDNDDTETLNFVALSLDLEGDEAPLKDILEDFKTFPHLLETSSINWAEEGDGFYMNLDLALYFRGTEEEDEEEEIYSPAHMEEMIIDIKGDLVEEAEERDDQEEEEEEEEDD